LFLNELGHSLVNIRSQRHASIRPAVSRPRSRQGQT